jgi:two-component system nitrogen regulation response regulator GlnG
MSAQSWVLTALSAAGAGAYDYLPKPFDLDDLVAAVNRALAGRPDAKTRASAQAAEREERLPLIGRSAAMQEVYRVMARVTGTDLTVLIEGESGAGKERVARALHEYSRRASGPFTVVSLAAIPREAVEAELFGAGGTEEGRVAQAAQGTLFLDDIDDMPMDAQTRLLRLLQDGESNRRPDARVVAASKTNLGELVRQGKFRQDLFYRLNVVTIRLPPLRERLDDIGDLARAFLVRAKREGLPEKSIDARAIEMLKTHDWPGNVRELENLLKRAAALCPENVIGPREVERELAAGRAAMGQASGDQEALSTLVRRRLASDFAAAPGGIPEDGLYDRVMAEIEAPLLTLTLEATKGNQIRAAAILGINRNTLRKKIQTLGLRAGRSD